MLTAAVLLDTARDLHPTFTEEMHPRPVLLRALSRLQRSVLAEALARYPELVSVITTIPLPLADFAAGYTLPDHVAYDAGFVVCGTRTEPFGLVPHQQRHSASSRVFSGWIVANTLYLSGRPEQWTNVSEIRLHGTLTPADLTLTATLVLPTEAEDALVTGLGAFMAGRYRADRDDVPPPDARHFRAEADIARERFLQALWLKSSATDYQIPVVD